jgi:hypothetical protein
MTIAADFSITKNGAAYDIRWTGTTGTHTGLALHSWLRSLADDRTATGDDNYDITTPRLSQRKTDQIFTLINGANIDDEAAQHLYNCSISQNDGDDFYSGLDIVGSVNSPTTELQIRQNNAFLTRYWGTGLNVDASNNILCRLLIKTRSGGNDIDGKRVRVQANELGDEYAYFDITLGEGVGTAAIFAKADGNNTTIAATIAGWTDIEVTEGYQSIDLNNGNGAQPYFEKWTMGSRTNKQLYERTKWLQRRGTVSTIHGIDAGLFYGVTHSFAYDNEASGPFSENEILSWGSGATAGTGILLGLKDDGATGVLYMQLLTGVAPTNNIAIAGLTSSATCDVDGAVTKKNPPGNFFGQHTGSAVKTAYGVGVVATELTSSDILIDLESVEQQPPNNQSGSVTTLTSGDDYVFVAESTGAGSKLVKEDQFALASGNNIGDGDLVVKTSIGIKPLSGTLRVWNGTKYLYLEYSSYTASTFTIVGTLPSNLSEDANCFVTHIDRLADAASESFTMVYDGTPIDMVVRVSNGSASPKQDLEVPAIFGASGFSVAQTAADDD